MKIIPVASPHAVAPVTSNATAARAKAIEAFKAASPTPDVNTQAQPPVNPNSVQVEELGAVKASQAPETTEETVEQKAQVEVKPEPAKPVSEEWAKLARQEKAIRAKAQQQEQAFKQREAALLARESEAKSKSEFNQKGYVSLDRIKADILGVAQEAGISYDEIANQMLNPSKVDPRTQSLLDKMQAKIDALEKSTSENSTRQTEAQQQAYNSAVRQIELDTKALIRSEPDIFEAINQTGSIKDVVELITETFNKDGILMTVEEAAHEVEQYLVEEAEKLSNMKKIQSKRNAAQVQATPAKTQSPSSQSQTSQSIKTLTNATSSTRKLGARERALLAFKGELTK